MAELHDLVAPYAIDALDEAERLMFEEHLAQCDNCRHELAQLEDAVVGLGEAAATTPPDRMRSAVLDAIADLPQEAAIDAPPPRLEDYDNVLQMSPRRRRAAQWLAGIAAAAVVVLAVAVANLFVGGPSLDDIAAAPDVATIALQGEVGTAAFIYSDALDAGAFIGTLAEIGESQTYQLWLIDETGPNPAGIFVPTADGEVEFIVEAEIFPGQTLGLTIEPAGGSPAPTGEVLLAEPLS